MATYLECINGVLKRMREATVTSVNENALSALVGEFVNDAKRVVEDAHQWRPLVDTVIITTVAGNEGYNLSAQVGTVSGTAPRERTRFWFDQGSGNSLARINTIAFESPLALVPAGYRFVERQIALNQSPQARSTPSAFWLQTNPNAAPGISNITVRLDAVPDAVYALEFYIVNPQNDLTGVNDVLLIPKDPVVQLAYLYALYERGEELGEQLTLTEDKALNALQDAIAIDNAMQASSLAFTPPVDMTIRPHGGLGSG